MSSLSTPLSKRIGLKYPIVCAPMFIISNKEMLLASAEAGILGAMPSLNARTPEKLRADLEWLRRKTDKPFAINMTIGLTQPERLMQDAALCEEFDVPVWITSYGNPTPFVERAHKKGALVFHDVINLRHGQKAEKAGADAIIGVSAGAGGHAGQITPYALIPYLKENLNVPIIAAGAVSTGRQILASLALGAELVHMGTRFIASKECGASDAYKEKVVGSSAEDIVYTDQVSGIHANFIKSTLPTGEGPGGGPEGAKRWKDIWSAGQGVVEIKDVLSIERIVEDLVREYHDALSSLPR